MSRTTARIATIALLLGAVASPALAGQTAAPSAQATARQPATADVRAAYDRADALSRQIFWTDQAEIDPMDPVAGVKAAQALRELGRFDQAAEMAGKVLLVQPTNVEAMLETGRAHIARGHAFYGIAALEQARNARPGDWRAWSLLGAAYQQVRRQHLNGRIPPSTSIATGIGKADPFSVVQVRVSWSPSRVRVRTGRAA